AVQFQCADRAGPAGGTVVDRRVELDLAINVGIARVPDGVVVGVVLHHPDGGFHRVEGRAATVQDGPAGIKADRGIGAAEEDHRPKVPTNVPWADALALMAEASLEAAASNPRREPTSFFSA